MARVESLTIATIGANAAMASVRSLAAALAALGDGAAECVAGSIDLLDESGDLIVSKAVDAPAAGAGKLEAIKFDPSDRYLELCAALAGSGHANIVSVDHGWPILSLGSGNPSVTEAGGVSNAPGGGAA
ncbi:MAG: hypothetical protein CMN72_07840 [Sphingomonas sp.]|nr:hypothetical protein [Sphingomonas sp.]